MPCPSTGYTPLEPASCARWTLCIHPIRPGTNGAAGNLMLSGVEGGRRRARRPCPLRVRRSVRPFLDGVIAMNGNVTDGAAPIPRGHPAPKGEPPERPDAQVTALLERWQSTGDAAALEQLIAAVLPLVQKGIGSVLRKVNIRDPAATDDAVSLTLDHLRRLPGVGSGDRAVTRFVPGIMPRAQATAPIPARPTLSGYPTSGPATWPGGGGGRRSTIGRSRSWAGIR